MCLSISINRNFDGKFLVGRSGQVQALKADASSAEIHEAIQRLLNNEEEVENPN
jgi:hypothetical protein